MKFVPYPNMKKVIRKEKPKNKGRVIELLEEQSILFNLANDRKITLAEYEAKLNEILEEISLISEKACSKSLSHRSHT